MTQTKKDYLILKLILGVIVGILVGLYANDTHIQIIMTVKQIIGQVIFYTIPLIIVGFITLHKTYGFKSHRPHHET